MISGSTEGPVLLLSASAAGFKYKNDMDESQLTQNNGGMFVRKMFQYAKLDDRHSMISSFLRYVKIGRMAESAEDRRQSEQNMRARTTYTSPSVHILQIHLPCILHDGTNHLATNAQGSAIQRFISSR